MNIDETRNNILEFAKANNLKFYPKKSLDEHLVRYISLNHCPCRRERPICPCPESLEDIKARGRCVCWLLCSEEHYDKMIKGEVEY